MDDTQQSRTSDAAATRKRRSSILKSQRPPRAPFSEVEFNVTTPTDTAKSRRVSFSRRTGVAEFVTNEATNTWKNFYEEHNKSLESSGNESAANQHRPSVGHLGKRIFEDQFQEVEAIDFGSGVVDSKGVETSINNVKFDQFALECSVDDRKLAAPGHNFEFSTFTVSEQPSKLFADDLAISGLGNISDKINVNFSIMQPLGDDLDEIQKDLERHQTNPQNIVCPGPQNERNISYIEVDLNTTHVACADDADALSEDMSITDTIHSPKVNVSKNSICGLGDRSLNKDWVTDKENIAINPYVAPKESANFVINEDSDKILVFDGKRATFQSVQEPLIDYRKTLVSNELPEKPPQRKTIVLNIDDDLPNFVANPHMSQNSKNYSLNETQLDNDCEISLTQALPVKIKTDSSKRQTIVFEDSSGNISMTQGLPTNIELKQQAKRATIVFDNDAADISVTQAVTANIFIPLQNEPVNEVSAGKRKTMVFEDIAGNISMTQALPTNMILGKSEPLSIETAPVGKRNTMVFEDDAGNVSMTQALPTNMILGKTEPLSIETAPVGKRKTMVFEDDTGNISITQALPTNMILGKTEPLSIENASAGKRRTMVFEDDAGNVSMTQALPTNMILGKTVPLSIETAPVGKRKTMVFEDDTGNISMTQALPTNMILGKTEPLSIENASTGKKRTMVFEDDAGNVSMTQALPTNMILGKTEPLSIENASAGKRRTMVFEDDAGNVSMTQALPTNMILGKTEPLSIENASTGKRRTMVFEDDAGNVSMTQALPTNMILGKTEPLSIENASAGKRRTMVFKDDAGNVSMTQALPTNMILGKTEPLSIETAPVGKRKTMVFEDDTGNFSMTQALPTNMILGKTEPLSIENASAGKRRTMVFEDDAGNVSITQALPTNMILGKTEPLSIETAPVGKRKTMLFEDDAGNISMTQALPTNMILGKTEPLSIENASAGKRRTMVFEDDAGNVSMTQALPTNMILGKTEPLSIETAPVGKRKTMLFEDDAGNISMTQALPTNMILGKTEPLPVENAPAGKRRTMVFEVDAGNISMMQALPTNMILGKTEPLPVETAPAGKREMMVFEDDAGNISMTQALPTNMILGKTEPLPVENAPASKRNTMVFEDDAGNISITHALLTNMILGKMDPPVETNSGSVIDTKTRLLSTSLSEPKSEDVVYNDEDGYISLTKVIPSSLLNVELANQTDKISLDKSDSLFSMPPLNLEQHKRKTLILNNQAGNISMTETVPSDLILSKEVEPQKRKTIVLNDDDGNKSITKPIPSNLIPSKEVDTQKRKTIILNDEEENISITKTISSNAIPSAKVTEKISDQNDILSCALNSELKSEKRNPIVFNDDGNISLTIATSLNEDSVNKTKTDIKDNISLLAIDKQANKSPVNFLTSLLDNENLQSNKLQYSMNKSGNVSLRPKVFVPCEETDNFDVSMTFSEVQPSNINFTEKRKTVVCDDDATNISVTQAVPANLVLTETNGTICCNKLIHVSITDTIDEKVDTDKTMCEDHHQSLSIIPDFSETKVKFYNSNLESVPKESPVNTSTNVVLACATGALDKTKTILQENINMMVDDISMTATIPNQFVVSEISNKLQPNKTDVSMNEDRDENIRDEAKYLSKIDSENVQRNQITTQNKSISEACQEKCKAIMDSIIVELASNEIVSENDKHLQNVMVYQSVNISKISLGKQILQQDSTLSTISSSNGKVESEVEHMASDDEIIINAEYVTVSHRLPILTTVSNSEEDVKSATESRPTVESDESSASSHNLNQNALPEKLHLVVKAFNPDLEKSHSDISNSIMQSRKSTVDEIQKKYEKSVLHDLLNMDDGESSDSGSGIVDKSVTAKVSNMKNSISNTTTSTDSNDLFYITKDQDTDDTPTDKSDDERNLSKNIVDRSINVFKYQLETQPPLNITIGTGKENYEVMNSSKNRQIETVVRSNRDDVTDISFKSHKDANSTKDLLEMLSKFTEKEEEDNPIKPITKKRDSAENGSGPVRAGLGMRRLSIALSREDLINNISMAQAVLRSSVGTEPDDTTEAEDTDQENTPSPKTNVRLSSELVAKTLRFDDETFTETKDISTVLTTPLKKTAFGESSYMRDKFNKKSNVIPTHLKDVTDELKSQMTELLKPTFDDLPFGSEGQVGTRLEQGNSNCSVQANLFTSSQIDLEPEQKVLKGIIKPRFELPSETSSDGSDRNADPQSTTSEASGHDPPLQNHPADRSVPSVLPFDPENPLNNVLLAPFDFRDAHRYKPPTPETREERPNNVTFKEVDSSDLENVNVQYNVLNVIPKFLQKPAYNLEKSAEKQNAFSISNRTSTIDQAVETINRTITDEGINTDITMQDNKKLLEINPSLTIDNSLIMKGKIDKRSSMSNKTNTETVLGSEFEVIYQQEAKKSVNSESDEFSENDYQRGKEKKTDKRKHKKNNSLLAQDVTPTPAAKILKRLMSPVEDKNMHQPKTMSADEKSSRDLFGKEESYDIPMIDRTKQPAEALSSTSHETSHDLADTDSEMGSCADTVRCAAPDWRPDLLNEPSSKDLVASRDCEDVKLVIDQLPFMGSSECAWEEASADSWSFLLMHARLRLTVRLARTHSSTGHVRASARIKNITIEQVQDVPPISPSDHTGVVCVRLAAEAMRRACGAGAARGAGGAGAARGGGGAGAARAGDVPSSLRAAAPLARAATRWRRAMCHAWVHLAYTLDEHGGVTLTAANVPLRCVWEVRLRIELADNDQGVPCPVATVKEVSTRAGAVQVSVRELHKATQGLATDWGHVPRAIWKIFRYLKNKTHEHILQ